MIPFASEMRILMLFACRKRNRFDSSWDRQRRTQPTYPITIYNILLYTYSICCLAMNLSKFFFLGAILFFLSQFVFYSIDFIMHVFGDVIWCETMRINANLLRMCMHKRNLSIYCVRVISLLAKSIQLKLFCHTLTFFTSSDLLLWSYYSLLLCRWKCVPFRYSNYILHSKQSSGSSNSTSRRDFSSIFSSLCLMYVWAGI